MVGYIKCLLILLFVISTALCDVCVTYDFEGYFNDAFNQDTNLCNGLEEWKFGKYNESYVESPHPDTNLFISPSDKLSCVTSFSFEMTPTGVLEVLVYMESVSQNDQILILVNQVNYDTVDTFINGMYSLTSHNTNYTDGWHILRIDLIGTSDFKGYITFMGTASPGSTVLVDSFKYIPYHEDHCYVYEENFVPPTRPPQIIPDSGDCVTYDFEDNFHEAFNSNSRHCTGFSEWILQAYATIPVDSPVSGSYHFITPQDHISCTSSFPFTAARGGIIEVNVYMESRSLSDQIAVLVNKIMGEDNDVVTGNIVHTPLLTNYVDGWQVLRIELSGDSSYYGYISFLGVASADSIVLVDSFRYIPPKLPIDVCKIYEEELFLTTTPVPITTPTPTGQECVTFDFESNFHDSFYANNQLCRGYSPWHLGSYYSLSIESINPESNTFIWPNETSSCISSFVFEMKPEGSVEVNVFMKSISDLDFVIVLAMKIVPNGIDTVSGLEMYYASNADFVEGWNVLKVPISYFSPFNGYITLIGAMSEDSIVLIDSFRYIPPNYEEPCKIY